MKEVGHVQNWATTIEADMRTISTALEYAYKGKLWLPSCWSWVGEILL